MYCRNCGKEIENKEAVICVGCGTKVGLGKNFCHSCGSQIKPNSEVCLNCGSSTKQTAPAVGGKSKILAGILGIFLGAFGVHNFYLGYTQRAVIQLVATILGFVLSCTGIGVLVVLGIEIWGLVEGIMILCGKIDTDGQGNPLAD